MLISLSSQKLRSHSQYANPTSRYYSGKYSMLADETAVAMLLFWQKPETFKASET